MPIQITALSKAFNFSTRCDENVDYPEGIYDAVSWAKRLATSNGVSLTMADEEELEEMLAQVFDRGEFAPGGAITLGGIAFASSWVTREGIASSTSTSPQVLEALVTKGYPELEVLLAVAENTSTPPRVLETLAQDLNYDVRLNVAMNTSTPTRVLEAFAQDPVGSAVGCWRVDGWCTRRTGADHHDKRDMIKALADKRDMIKALAMNTSTPPRVLEALAQDLGKAIAGGLRDDAARHDRLVLMAIARNTSTPTRVLKSLALHSDEGIRASVAMNTSTPTRVLEALAQDKSGSYVRANVAMNTSTPTRVLESLGYVRDGDAIRKRGIKVNPTAKRMMNPRNY